MSVTEEGNGYSAGAGRLCAKIAGPQFPGAVFAGPLNIKAGGHHLPGDSDKEPVVKTGNGPGCRSSVVNPAY
jgi:hypothetical protein